MKNYLYLIFALLTSLLFSCKSENTFKITKEIQPVEKLALDSLATDASQILVKDSVLFMCISDKGPILEVYNLNTGKLINKIGRRGKGPEELLFPSSMQYYKKTNSIWVYDQILSKYLQYDINNIMNEKSGAYIPANYMEITRNAGILYNPLWINDTSLVALGFNGPERLTYLNKNDAVVRSEGRLPKPEIKNVPYPLLGQAYQSNMFIKPDFTRLAIAARHSDYIEVYSSQGKLIKSEYTTSGFKPIYDVSNVDKNPVLALTDKTKLGYVDLTGNDKYIIGLFSGKDFKETASLLNFGYELHVFDWKGTLLYKLILKEPLQIISMGTDDNVIYGTHLTKDGSVELLAYHILN